MIASPYSAAGTLSALATQALDPVWLGGIALLTLRVAATFAMTPVLYAAPLPNPVRLLLVLCLSLALASGLATQPAPWTGWSPFMTSALSELALGATFGLGILLAFGAFAVAGQLLDVQLGFGIAQIIDPLTRRPVPVLTSAFQITAVLVFFLVDGHHALLRGIGYSLARFPVGAPWSLVSATGPIFQQAGGLFSLGFALAAPIVLCILLVEFALGVISRNLPQMNMFTMGIPVKIVVGLIALSFWFVGIGGVMTRVYASVANTWDAIFVLAGPER